MRKIDKPLYEHLGAQLKKARQAKKYSLADVATMVGRSKASIKRYEDASVRIDMDTLDLLCNVLDVKPQSMFISTGDDIVERVVLVPDPKEEKKFPWDVEFQTAEDKKQKALNAIFEKFMQLDTNAKKIILMMLKFNDEKINEILNTFDN